MCMEDIRIGRALEAQAKTVALQTNAVTPVLGADPNRTRIIFSSDASQLVTVAPIGITPAALTGFILPTTVEGRTIRVEDWGKLVTGPWTAFTTAAGVILSVAEAGTHKQ